MRVDHFRPQHAVSGAPGHAGYWWLAAEWTNLIPSCEQCNGNSYKHVHLLNGESAYLKIQSRKSLTGKLDNFPIVGIRADSATDSLSAEEPLLIDPTETDPKAHLAWVVENDLSLVSAALINEVPCARGHTTYRVLGLNRQKLVEARTELMRRILDDFLSIRENAIEAIHSSDPSTRKRSITRIERDIARIMSYTNENREYSAMALSTIEKQMKILIADMTNDL